jgi:transcriptional regulator with XRE-family HTH domain
MARTLEEILKNEKPEIVANAQKKAEAMLLDIHLAELRKRANCTQLSVADAIGVKQPTVAGMEKQGQDIRLSSLKKYVEAIGGKMSIDVELSDGSHYGFNI